MKKKPNKQTKKNLHTRQRLACQHSDLLKGGIVQKQWIHSSTSRAWRSENNQMKKNTLKKKPIREYQSNILGTRVKLNE